MNPLKRKSSQIDSGNVNPGNVKVPENYRHLWKEKVPVLEGHDWALGVFVFVLSDDSGTYYAPMSIVRSEQNMNKYFHMQLVTDGENLSWILRKYGRQGGNTFYKASGPSTISNGKAEFGREFLERTGLPWINRYGPSISGKYVFTETRRKYTTPLPLKTKRLIELIDNDKYNESTVEDLPIKGEVFQVKLDDATISRGRSYLQKILGLFVDLEQTQGCYLITQSEKQRRSNYIAQQVTEGSDLYFSTIPRASGSRHAPALTTRDAVESELQSLERLQSIQNSDAVAVESKKGMSARARLREMRVDIHPLDDRSDEFKDLENYLERSALRLHGLSFDVEEIFSVQRRDERDRPWSSSLTRLLLFHGSPITNFASILSNGLRIPDHPSNGEAFGRGIYFADVSSKSAKYCSPELSDSYALLLLCEVEVGTTHDLHRGYVGADTDCKKARRIAIRGLGQTVPSQWRDAASVNSNLSGVTMPEWTKAYSSSYGGLFCNEYVVFNPSQVKLRYIVYTEIKSAN